MDPSNAWEGELEVASFLTIHVQAVSVGPLLTATLNLHGSYTWNKFL